MRQKWLQQNKQQLKRRRRLPYHFKIIHKRFYNVDGKF